MTNSGNPQQAKNKKEAKKLIKENGASIDEVSTLCPLK